MKFIFALKKEFLALYRDKAALLALFLMPSIFILIMSIALKDAYNEYRVLSFKYILVNLDEGNRSKEFIKELNNQKGLSFVINSSIDEAKALVKDEQYKFAILINKNFSKDIYKVDSQKLITLYTSSITKPNIKLFFKSKIIEILAKMKMKNIVNSLTMYDEKIKITPLDTLITVKHLYKTKEKKTIPTATQQNVPAWIVFCMFFIIIPISTLFITEKNFGTFKRLKGMNISKSTIFASKAIPYIIVNQIQIWLMILVGVYLVPLLGGDKFDLDVKLFGLIIISLAISIAAIGFAILLSSVAKTTEQATTIGALSNVIMGAVGGIMVPQIVMPSLMQKLTVISPMHWGLEGMLDVFVRNSNYTAVLFESFVLVTFGIICMVFATYFYERE